MFNFPNAPTIGDTYTFNAKTWVWNGAAWDVSGTITTGGGGGSGGTSTSTTTSLLNASGNVLSLGMPVYSNGNGTVSKAQANSLSTSKFIGLVYDMSIANGASGNIMTDGVLSASSLIWDGITGQTGGLTFNTMYYLSATTAGKLTATPPATFIVEVGIAISTTQLKILSTNLVE